MLFRHNYHARQVGALTRFYYHVAMLIHKAPQHRTTLDEISKTYDRNTAFSWMQWADAKQWFESSMDGYYLKPHVLSRPPYEIFQSIRDYYRQ